MPDDASPPPVPFYCFTDQAKLVDVRLNSTAVDACARLCAGDPACRAFSHSKDEGTCRLHGSFVPSDTLYCTKRLWDTP